MMIDSERLSAYLDGELSPREMREIETALEKDNALQAELSSLMEANRVGVENFEKMLSAPVSDSLANTIRSYEPKLPANSGFRPSGWAQFAVASCAALCIGLSGGYLIPKSSPPDAAAERGWLDDIADYHAVYAKQKRHLVEVDAEESDHIETWLTASVGTNVQIPDLQSSGLKFEGGRLVVASGLPVAQLLYTDADENVVALCLIKYPYPSNGFTEQTVGEFDMVTWSVNGAYYVVVGDTGRADLLDIANTAATEI